MARNTDHAMAKGIAKGALTMEWQPIETAPKDGTWVLCYGLAHDEDASEPRIFTAVWTNWRNGKKLKNWWWQFAWFDGGYYGECEPTHWMPIPAPPQVSHETRLTSP
jgi:hypothetical protein